MKTNLTKICTLLGILLVLTTGWTFINDPVIEELKKKSALYQQELSQEKIYILSLIHI